MIRSGIAVQSNIDSATSFIIAASVLFGACAAYVVSKRKTMRKNRDARRKVRQHVGSHRVQKPSMFHRIVGPLRLRTN